MFFINMYKNQNNNKYTDPAIIIGMVGGFIPSFIAPTIMFRDEIHKECEDDILCWAKEMVIGGPIFIGLVGAFAGGVVGYVAGDILDYRDLHHSATILSGDTINYGTSENV